MLKKCFETHAYAKDCIALVPGLPKDSYLIIQYHLKNWQKTFSSMIS